MASLPRVLAALLLALALVGCASAVEDAPRAAEAGPDEDFADSLSDRLAARLGTPDMNEDVIRRAVEDAVARASHTVRGSVG